MEENGDTEDREEKKDEVKGEARQKCTRDIFVHHVDRVSNMVFIMMLSLQPNMLVKRLAALHWPFVLL